MFVKRLSIERKSLSAPGVLRNVLFDAQSPWRDNGSTLSIFFLFYCLAKFWGALLQKMENFFLPALVAGFSLLTASLVNFLNYNDYPLFRGDVGIVIGFIGAISLMLALLYKSQRDWTRAFLEGLFVFAILELNSAPSLISFGTGALIFLALGFWKKSILPFAAIAGVVMTLTTLAGIGGGKDWVTVNSSDERSNVDQLVDRPAKAVLHILLDEHAGINGFPSRNTDAQRIRKELRDFYLSRGFNLYGGAYSEHFYSINAIPKIFNYGERLGESPSKEGGVKLGETTHLAALTDMGYALKIYQSDYAEFCKDAEVQSCLTYGVSSLGATLDYPLTLAERVELITFKFLSLSRFLKAVDRWFKLPNGSPVLDLNAKSNSSTIGALTVFDMLIDDLGKARPGEAYVAHILLPHYPHITNSDCTIRRKSSWEMRRSTSPVGDREAAYYDQIRCSMEKVDQAITALEQSAVGDEFVVIVHSDHGSRITRRDPTVRNMGKFDNDDLIAGFASLFAVRAPGLASNYSDDPAALALLLGEFTKSGFEAAPDTAGASSNAKVMLADGDWVPVKNYPLPQNWMSQIGPRKAEVKPETD